MRLYCCASFICVVLLAGDGALAQVRDAVTPEDGVGETEDAPAPEARDRTADAVGDKIRSLDLRERVAQLMLVTLQGAIAPDPEDRAFLTSCTPGGVIIAGVLRPSNAADYILKLRSLPIEAETGIPLLIGTDVYNLPRYRGGVGGYFVQLPSLLTIAAADDAESTNRLASLVADHLTRMGFNMHLGPSLELAPELTAAYGHIQCLGSDPAFAARTGCSILSALWAKGITAVPMGFPGGGANRLPQQPGMLLTPGAHWEESAGLPFVRAIESGARVLHVANTLVPTLDPDRNPASLSSVVMRDLLRHRLGFEGVVVAGPMDDPDITRTHDPSEAAIQSLKAGADMIYWTQAGSLVTKSVNEIAYAVKTGALSEAVVNAALARALALKEALGLLARDLPNEKDCRALETKRRYAEEAYLVERRSITMAQNRGNTLPLTEQGSLPLGVTGVVAIEELRKALEKHIKPVAQQVIATAKHVGEIADFEIHRVTSHVGGANTVICVFPDMRKTDGQVKLIRALKDEGARTVVVLLGYPGNLSRLADADAIVVAYCDPSRCAETIKAVADVLVGKSAIRILHEVADVRAEVGKAQVFSAFDLVCCPPGRLPVDVGAPYVAQLAVAYDPTQAVKRVQWDFGDGKTAKDFRAEHAFESPGRYPVTMTVTDTLGEVTSGVFHVVVN